ncbi:hypothetical protein P7K49_020686 [Saguinus oedipus]|uniref:Uncharacterized protein n=1 Tax=Saguinus oedipus TaxID=9490 RepID=A0ABQ9V0Z0_SAGOE|nr:hypothetical protein P7K49_020686 [Saguinus oedipus]
MSQNLVLPLKPAGFCGHQDRTLSAMLRDFRRLREVLAAEQGPQGSPAVLEPPGCEVAHVLHLESGCGWALEWHEDRPLASPSNHGRKSRDGCRTKPHTGSRLHNEDRDSSVPRKPSRKLHLDPCGWERPAAAGQLDELGGACAARPVQSFPTWIPEMLAPLGGHNRPSETALLSGLV